MLEISNSTPGLNLLLVATATVLLGPPDLVQIYKKTPQNVDLSPTTSGSPIFSDQMQQLNKSNESNERIFQSKLQANKNILLVGESQYYPRVTDRADV